VPEEWSRPPTRYAACGETSSPTCVRPKRP